MAKPRQDRRQLQRHGGSWWNQLSRTSYRRFFRLLLILPFLAVIPPIFFHFRLKRFQQMQLKKCGWLNNPPLVCAHGGDSTNAFPNTASYYLNPKYQYKCKLGLVQELIDAVQVVVEKLEPNSRMQSKCNQEMSAYRIALLSHVDCIEIDVSRSSDGVLFALHDRDLQRISGNNTAKVGHLSMKEIKQLHGRHLQEFENQEIPTIEDALRSVSRSVRPVILDAKVGPSYEQGLAKDILSVVGYIVMKDPSTGTRTNLLRMKRARVVGVYHPLIDEELVKILRGRNKKVYAWTVDDQVSMHKMLLERVDAVVTSNPTLLQQLMQEIRTQCLEEGFVFQ